MRELIQGFNGHQTRSIPEVHTESAHREHSLYRTHDSGSYVAEPVNATTSYPTDAKEREKAFRKAEKEAGRKPKMAAAIVEMT